MVWAVARSLAATKAVDSFPGLIAVFHALHRLLAPRHPPHALNSLAALILFSIRVRHAPRNRMLPATRPSRCRPGHSNDPVSPKGSCRDSQETTTRGQPRRVYSRSRSCDCNSYRYRIVKELASSHSLPEGAANDPILVRFPNPNKRFAKSNADQERPQPQALQPLAPSN
jgi:hypothetical protein